VEKPLWHLLLVVGAPHDACSVFGTSTLRTIPLGPFWGMLRALPWQSGSNKVAPENLRPGLSLRYSAVTGMCCGSQRKTDNLYPSQ
jgi:hypothetical protein